MATDDFNLGLRFEMAMATIDSVMRGLQEIADGTDLQHTLYSFSNALEAARPALKDVFGKIEKELEEVARG